MGVCVKIQLAAPGWLLQHGCEPVHAGVGALWLAEFALWMDHVQTSSSAEPGLPCTITPLSPEPSQQRPSTGDIMPGEKAFVGMGSSILSVFHGLSSWRRDYS